MSSVSNSLDADRSKKNTVTIGLSVMHIFIHIYIVFTMSLMMTHYFLGLIVPYIF